MARKKTQRKSKKHIGEGKDAKTIKETHWQGKRHKDNQIDTLAGEKTQRQSKIHTCKGKDAKTIKETHWRWKRRKGEKRRRGDTTAEPRSSNENLRR